MQSLLSIAVATAALVATGAASAERPATLAGAAWALQANRTVLQMVSDTQTGPGVTVLNTHFGDLGEYNFSATR